MTRLRDRLQLPATVQVGSADRLLRLDMGEPMDVAVLRAFLDDATTFATVAEAPTATDHGWLHGRAHEIVVPLASTAPPARAPAAVIRPGPLPLVGREHGILPGSRVLSVKLYGHPDGFDAILTGHLPTLLSAWQEPPRWWFIRYRDPGLGPHLRLRLHLADADAYGQAVVAVGAWADGLRRHGLIGDLTVGTYRPETARYGTGPALAAAETVFAADSRAVLAQLTALTGSRQVHAHALTAASLVDLAAAVTGGRTAGTRWLIDHPQSGPATAPDRQVLRQTTGLTTGDDALQAIEGGPSIAAAWQERRRAAAAYADRLAADAGQVKAESVLVALLHLHHVRAHGINTNSELLCYRLARAAALACNAPNPETKTDPR
jgi:thiopeptide-type bacteriocin biosynthesis protein